MNKKQIQELLIQMIFESATYNGHYQTNLSGIPFEALKKLTEWINESGMVTNYCEIRLTYEAGKWDASIYSVGEWFEGDHPLNHKDQLILSVENVTGI